MRTLTRRAAGPVVGLFLLTTTAACADSGDGPFAVPTKAVTEGPGAASTAPPTAARPTTTAPPKTTAPPRTRDQARALATSLALTPEDWGAGFTKQTTYEGAGESWSDYAADCSQQTVALPASLLGQWSRAVQLPDPAGPVMLTSGSTNALVYQDARAARDSLQNNRQVDDRCAKRTFTDGTKITFLPGAPQPAFPDADEVLAEEGEIVQPDGGGPYPYLVLSVRKDGVVLVAYLKAPTKDRLTDIRTRCTQAARLMLDRLERS
jgi:hypothetical protein